MTAGPTPPIVVFDPSRRYRYLLRREAGLGQGECCWVMLNPSIADEELNDPTIRRCLGFARTWGYSSISVVNLFALRSPDPDVLLGEVDPQGPLSNDAYILAAALQAGRVLVAWGAHPAARQRGAYVAQMLAPHCRLWCLGQTKGGAPRHPLYVAGDQPGVIWQSDCPTGAHLDSLP